MDLKWCVPIILAALGALATAVTAQFKAGEAYTSVRVLEKDNAANSAEHKLIINTLERIEKRLDRLNGSK